MGLFFFSGPAITKPSWGWRRRGGECAERQNHMFFLNSKECSFPSARSSHFFHQNFGAVDMRAQALSGPLPWSNLKIQRHALPLITATAQPVFWPYWAGKRQVTALPLYHLSLSFPDVVYQPTNLFSTSWSRICDVVRTDFCYCKIPHISNAENKHVVILSQAIQKRQTKQKLCLLNSIWWFERSLNLKFKVSTIDDDHQFLDNLWPGAEDNK